MQNILPSYLLKALKWAFSSKLKIGSFMGFVGGWLALNNFIGLPLPPDLLDSAKGALSQSSPAAVITPTVPKCTSFDREEWQEGQGLLVPVEDYWQLATSAPNGLFRYKKAIPLDSNVRVTFVSLSENQPNFVATMHDLYEVTVGDGNDRGITVKVAQGDSDEMKLVSNTEGERRITFGEDIEKGSDITLILQQAISRLDNGSYELNLRLSQPASIGLGSAHAIATYIFPLPPHFKYQEKTARFSIGLKRSTDKTQVAARFLCIDFD